MSLEQTVKSCGLTGQQQKMQYVLSQLCKYFMWDQKIKINTYNRNFHFSPNLASSFAFLDHSTSFYVTLNDDIFEMQGFFFCLVWIILIFGNKKAQSECTSNIVPWAQQSRLNTARFLHGLFFSHLSVVSSSKVLRLRPLSSQLPWLCNLNGKKLLFPCTYKSVFYCANIKNRIKLKEKFVCIWHNIIQG